MQIVSIAWIVKICFQEKIMKISGLLSAKH